MRPEAHIIIWTMLACFALALLNAYRIEYGWWGNMEYGRKYPTLGETLKERFR